jgi:hypothetical protein
MASAIMPIAIVSPYMRCITSCASRSFEDPAIRISGFSCVLTCLGSLPQASIPRRKATCRRLLKLVTRDLTHATSMEHCQVCVPKSETP